MTDQQFRYLQATMGAVVSPTPSPSPTPGGTSAPPWAEPSAIPGTGQPWYYPYPGPSEDFSAGNTTQFNLWRNLYEMTGGQVPPELMGPQAGVTGIHSTDPMNWEQAGVNPLPAPIPVGTPQPVPQFGQNHPSAYAGTSPVSQRNIDWGNQLIRDQSADQTRALDERYTARLIKEGMWGGPGTNPNYPKFRPDTQFEDPSLPPPASLEPETTTAPFPGSPTPYPDVPGQVQVFTESNPPSVTFPENYWGDQVGAPVNPPPNETMYPTDMGYFPPDQMPDYWTGNMPDTVYNPAPAENNYPNESNNYIPYQPTNVGFDTTGEMQNPPGGAVDTATTPQFNITAPLGGEFDSSQFLQNIPTDFVTDNLKYDTGGAPPPPPSGVYDPSQGSVMPGPAMPTAGGTPPTGYYGPAGPNTVGNADPGLLPNAPGINYANSSQGMRDADGNIIPGTSVSASGNANSYNMTQFPGGGFFRDAVGNILDSAGNMIASAADFAGKFGGSIANVARAIPGAVQSVGEGFVNSLPHDWGGFGQPMGFFGVPDPPIPGTFGVNEPGVNRSGEGWPSTGITINDIINSGVNPSYGNFAPGQVGRSSVPAPAGGTGPDQGGSMSNFGASSWGNAMNLDYLRRMMKGIYTNPETYASMLEGTPSPISSAPGPPSFAQFHQSQVQLGDILRANPSFVSNFNLGRRIGEGPPAKLSPHTPRNLPV